MQIKRKKQRRGNPILAVCILLVLIAGVSYGGATLWQRLQEADTGSPQSSAASVLPDPAEPSDVESIGAQAEASLPVTQAVGTPVQQSEQSEPDSEPAEEPAATDYTVSWQVKPSAEVPLSYFDDAIFFGDSVSTGLTGYHIVDNAACYAAIGVSPHTALTVGYIGATVDNKKTLLDAALEAGERSKVYIMLGGNGLWMEQDAFIAAYQDFLDAVRAQYPDAVIYLQSITPVGEHVTKTYDSITKEKVVAYNTAIAELAKKNGYAFVNVFECLMDENGDLPAEVSPDGLHLSAEYYHKWFAYLRTHTLEGL